ncbi:hypothetical protein [Haloarcula litorea]|uniref:hypothetical protein n=1 Tax=Haloarcula litorea TaxID=3032579 RepID=UPI0023E8D066|nr:hypothetical protein [Halomicroarcula sp. GDY20]
MIGSRTVTAAAGLLASLAVSAALWWYFDTLAVFLVVPFVPFLSRRLGGDEDRPPARECPECGFRTRSPEFDYCPRDGRRLGE